MAASEGHVEGRKPLSAVVRRKRLSGAADRCYVFNSVRNSFAVIELRTDDTASCAASIFRLMRDKECCTNVVVAGFSRSTTTTVVVDQENATEPGFEYTDFWNEPTRAFGSSRIPPPV